MKALVILCFLVLHGEGRRIEGGVPGPCPPGVEQVKCMDPCSQATCPSHPTAVCRSNDCGNCTAEFFLKVEC